MKILSAWLGDLNYLKKLIFDSLLIIDKDDSYYFKVAQSIPQ